MGKLILCYMAVALGIQAQETASRVMRLVSAGPPAHPNLAPMPQMPPSPQTLASPATNLPAAGTSIVYTCDPSITALSPGICNTLNTTIAGLYRSVFTNANATIYVKLGNVDLGESDSWSNYISYSTFRNLMIAAEAGPNDVTAVTNSLPPVNIDGSNMVQLNTALQRALGYANPTNGIDQNDSFCNTNGSNGCYDGLITISSTQPLYFRTGTISSQQFDFFAVIQHETDEILGVGSCAFGDCSNVVDPADYLRYHSNGTRAFGEGTNNPCTSSDSTNACFSLDGVHMLQQYNNLSGEDAGDWAMNCAVPRVQNDVLCSGTSGIDISPTAEIILLDIIGYTLRTPYIAVLSSANPATVWLAPGSLASAYGTGSDFATGPLGNTPLPLPTNFGGTSVSILDSSGVKTLAPLLYVNSTQVNFEVPPGVAAGAAQVTITSGDGTQSVANVQIAAVAPGIFELNSAGLGAAQVVVSHSDGTQTVEQVDTVDSAGAVVANPVSLGSSTDHAYLVLFGTGLQAAGTAGVTVSVAGETLPVLYGGPQGGCAGLDQVNVQLPSSLAGKGNVTIQVTADDYAANPVNITIQ